MLSRKSYHALEAILTVALHHGVQPVNGRRLAAMQGLPPRYLERALQKCAQGNILRSVRGPRGGYVLARERRRITLAEILQVLRSAEENDPAREKTATPLADSVLRPLCREAETLLETHFAKTTLAMLCEGLAASPRAIKASDSPRRARSEFAI